jgi:deoxyguanosine kinase
LSNKVKYIAIEGVIGAGKTTLSKKLSESLNAQLILEDFDENPFLERFYENPKLTHSTHRFIFCSAALSSCRN